MTTKEITDWVWFVAIIGLTLLAIHFENKR